MIRRLGIGAIAVGAFAGVLALAAMPAFASHDADISDDELKCQLSRGKCGAKFARAKLKCLNKCASAQQDGDPVDCKDSGPGGDGDPRDAETAACVADAETKGVECMAKKCDTDCPDCVEYDSGNCTTDGQSKVDDAEALVDINDSIIAHCNEPGATDDEIACQNERAKRGGSLVQDLAKCSAKCLKSAHKGDPRQCDPGGALDAEAQACSDAAVAKCAAKVDAKCTDVPECNTGNGTTQCNTVRGIVDAQYQEYYCGS